MDAPSTSSSLESAERVLALLRLLERLSSPSLAAAGGRGGGGGCCGRRRRDANVLPLFPLFRAAAVAAALAALAALAAGADDDVVNADADAANAAPALASRRN